MSFHTSSRLILHAEVSYIIDIACHWSFFPILPVLAIFWIAKTPIFFHFPTPNFCKPVPIELMFTHLTLITGLKHAISPYFGIVWVLFYNIFLWKSALNPEIWAENRKSFNKVGDVSDPETEEQMLVMCAWVCAIVSWRHEYLMSSKTGNSANVFRR